MAYVAIIVYGEGGAYAYDKGKFWEGLEPCRF